MKRIFYTPIILIALLTLFSSINAHSQYCDSLVPSINVDLSASPAVSWLSPNIVRDGNCCGSSAPDVCLEFVITLHPSTIALNFDIASGAVPPGALYYQVDCGPATAVGDPICLYGPGPHTLTFCKPGNNGNTFSIQTYGDPYVGPDITLNAGCQGYIYGVYYDETTINWTSIAPGPIGAYDNLLSCTSSCDTTYITAPVSAPPYVDYLVCGADVPGCNPNLICDTVRVTFIPPVQVQLSADDMSLCPGETTIITANTSGGSSPYSYSWSTGGTSTTINAGAGTYYIDVLDASGCYMASDSITIIQNPLPSVNAGPDQTVCEGEQVTLTGSGAVSYTWNYGVMNGVAFTPTLGTITYSVIGTDVNGCVNSDQVVIVVNPIPLVNAGPDQEVCDGDQVTLSAIGAQSYFWTNNVQDGVPYTPPVGTNIYSVTGTDNNGCSSLDDIEVIVNPLPNVNAGPDQGACEGDKVTLFGTGADSYNWSGGVIDGVSFPPTIASTTYVVIGTDDNGCQNTDSVIVEGWLNPNVYTQDAEICDGDPVILTGQGALDYSWTGGITDGQEFYPNSSGTYRVTGTDINGCTNEATAMVTVHSLPIVRFKITDPSITSLDPTTGFINLTIGGYTYSWDFGDGSPIDNSFEPTHTFPEDGGIEYAITLSSFSEFGCYNELTKYIHIFQDYTIYVPNAFTPDNDDYNQVFKPVMQGFDPYDYSLFIYDRWGELIFESHDMDVGWDGTYANQNYSVQQGAYTWKIVAGLEDSVDTKIFMGHVNLLK